MGPCFRRDDTESYVHIIVTNARQRNVLKLP
jgi:hypothetical protein